MSPFIPVPSASRAPLYMRCATAAVLPQSKSIGESMAFGNAGHEHLQLRASHGVDAAVASLPDIFRRHDLTEKQASILRSKLMKFEWCPPPGSLPEVFL